MSARILDNQESQSSDQRYLPRWEVNNEVIYQLSHLNEVRKAYTKDLSCAGACICTDHPVSPNQKIKLVIYLAKNIHVDVEGDILWMRKNNDEEIQLGINFRNISAESQDLILQHAFELDREKLVKHWFQGWDENL